MQMKSFIAHHIDSIIPFVLGLYLVGLRYYYTIRGPILNPENDEKRERRQKRYLLFGVLMMLLAAGRFMSESSRQREGATLFFAAWHTITTEDGVASAEMPGKPEETKGTVDVSGVPVAYQQFRVSFEKDIVFTFTHNSVTLSTAEERQARVKLMFTSVLSSLEQRGKHPRLVSQNEIHRADYEGMDYRIDVEDHVILITRYAHVNGLYHVAAAVPSSAKNYVEVQRFVKSLRILRSADND
jgi:hypothetical protein